MKAHAAIGIVVVAASFTVGYSSAARADDVRHSPDAHMEQNADRYRYDYDDGVCSYHYEYEFKTTKDHLDQKGDCRNVPIARYRPQAAIVPAYPPPGAAPPVAVPGAAAPVVARPQEAPAVVVGTPRPAAPSVGGAPNPPSAPAGIAVAPLQ